jgi:uncharacterized protein (TIGR02391 family)
MARREERVAMILTDREMQQVRQSIEAQARLDEELLRRCGHLLHMGAFDEAVRSAFVLLEERLRECVGEKAMTGTQLANYAFNAKDGPLAKHLGRNRSEREGLRELYSGAFKMFRNPTAHGTVDYDAADGKAIIGLVNLLLRMLRRVEELPPPELFPENVETMLASAEKELGPGAASRLRVFLGKCLKTGLKPATDAKQWIPFRRYALFRRDDWVESRPHRVAVFYLAWEKSEHRVNFPTSYYYADVVGFNLDRLVEELLELGFQLEGKNREPRISLRVHNDQAFFDALFRLVMETSDELEGTLQAGSEAETV